VALGAWGVVEIHAVLLRVNSDWNPVEKTILIVKRSNYWFLFG
jgi:hypothetical protein